MPSDRSPQSPANRSGQSNPREQQTAVDANRDLVREHLDNVPALARLNRRTRDEILSWLWNSRPFRGDEDLIRRISSASIKGLQQHHVTALAQSLRSGVGRRPFLAALGGGSLVALGVGLTRWFDLAGEVPTSHSRHDDPPGLRPLVAAIQQSRLPVGQTCRQELAATSGEDLRESLANDAARGRLGQFLHALDMSNWLEGALFLAESSFRTTIFAATGQSAMATLIEALHTLQQAWEFLQATRSQWEQHYFVAYAFGKMPALATPTAKDDTFRSETAEAQQRADAIRRLAPMFHALEILNQRFQVPGATSTGAPIRFTQGHNFSYAHLANDLADRSRFEEGRRTILVNWDAHADLGDPFENPRMPLEQPFETLQSAKSFGEKVVVSSSMSIAGWMVALLYEKFLPGNEEAEIVWVAPREAQQTSQHAMEPYGTYSFLVGDWHLPTSRDELERLSTTDLGDWSQPGSREIRRFSDRPTLRSVVSPDLLRNQRRCRLHLVDPDDTEHLAALVGDAQIALSIDADFAGTREPGLQPRRGLLPHYLVSDSKQDRARHRQLLDQLEAFCRRFASQIGTVSIANSPNFTVAEATRKPVAHILQFVAGDPLGDQPRWIADEIARRAPPAASPTTTSASDPLAMVLATGGIAGLAAVTSLLVRDKHRLGPVRRLLFDPEDRGERIV
jgi:hypothetical protein